ncbi:MAG: 4-alpha-glucanotransferase [Clostridia bacterium]|nr:4-alpha-glucanotransferase [Clostridia bacterium]
MFERRNLPLIAEDLGQISKSVEALRDALSMPGMFVSQFHLTSPKMVEQMKETIPERILYTGTHDNSTIISYLKYLNEDKKVKLRRVMKMKEEDINNRSYIEFVANLPYKVFILPMQDILGQDDKFRMNEPGTIDGNWAYRITSQDLNYEVRDYIHKLLADSNRLIKPTLRLIK